MKRKRRLTIVALLLAVSLFFPFTYTMDSERYSLRAVSGYQFLGEHLFLVLVLVVAYLLGLWADWKKDSRLLKSVSVLLVVVLYLSPFKNLISLGFLDFWQGLKTLLVHGLGLGYHISLMLVMLLFWTSKDFLKH